MTSDQAQKFIATYPNAKSFVKPSHLGELSPLLEAHIEAVVVNKAEFHALAANTYMPRKETLDKFAAAAGVSYNTLSERTRREGADCYVGSSQAMVMGPDGKMIMGDVCEYEFDVEVRLEELVLKGKDDWEHKIGTKPGKRPYTDQEKKEAYIDLKKVARQRANTGARSRATVSILGMQTGFKDLYGKDDSATSSKTFLFSRVIVNAKNELVMGRMLDNLAGNAFALYGPQPAALLENHAAGQGEARRVGPGFDDEPGRSGADGALGVDAFGDPLPPASAPAANPRVQELTNHLEDWANVDNHDVAAVAGSLLTEARARLVDEKVLEHWVTILNALASGFLREAGIAACYKALVDPATRYDLVILGQTAQQAASVVAKRSA
jgi:hypothetical protein